MTIITLVLAGYIALGWVAVVCKKSLGGFIITALLLWIIFSPIANWLGLDRELLFLFGVGIGSIAYLTSLKTNVSTFLFFLLVGAFVYLIVTAGFVYAALMFIAASVTSLVVNLPLRFLPDEYENITIQTQVVHASVFGFVAFGNSIFYILLNGIQK